jgi:hypothetical protein
MAGRSAARWSRSSMNFRQSYPRPSRTRPTCSPSSTARSSSRPAGGHLSHS